MSQASSPVELGFFPSCHYLDISDQYLDQALIPRSFNHTRVSTTCPSAGTVSNILCRAAGSTFMFILFPAELVLIL